MSELGFDLCSRREWGAHAGPGFGPARNGFTRAIEVTA